MVFIFIQLGRRLAQSSFNIHIYNVKDYMHISLKRFYKSYFLTMKLYLHFYHILLTWLKNEIWNKTLIYIQYLINQPTITFKILITYKMEAEGSVEYCGSLARPFSVKRKELFPLIRDNFSIERIHEKDIYTIFHFLKHMNLNLLISTLQQKLS